jgi:sulfur-oxidizing protein SoxY
MSRAVVHGLLAILSLTVVAFAAAAADDGTNPNTDIWRKVRADLFGDRAIADGMTGGRIVLDMPPRAADAAVVPLAVRIKEGPGDPPVKKLYVIVDRNPSPIAGIFEFGPASGGAALETRVRIEEYTWVRVIAERSDASLLIAQRFVKAAGGCSAPAGKSLAERLAGMGQMKWRIDPPGDATGATWVQLMIRHPNNSGLAMDQLTHLYDPPYYVRNVRVTRGDELVLAADVDFSISENPAFRFTLRPGGTGALHATATDSNERVFESTSP